MNETRPPNAVDGAATPVLAEPPAQAPAEAPARPRRVLTPRNYVWIAGAAVVLFFGLRYLGPVLTPFLIGAILAYLGTPIVNWAEERVSRGIATTVVVLLFGILLLMLFVVLIPLVQSEVTLAARRIPDFVSQLVARASPPRRRSSCTRSASTT